MFTHNTSLIIPTKDRPKELFRLLKQLRLFKINFLEILVIDSSSIENKKYLKKICEKFSIKLYTTWASTSHQRNVGLKKKKKSIFTMFLDDDVIFFKNSFFEMNRVIIKNQNNRSIAGFIFNQLLDQKIKFFENLKKNKLLECIGLYSSKPGKIMSSGWHTKILNVKNDIYADWAYTTASIYKSKDIYNYRFDERFGAYGYLEDLDFSLNLKKNNKKFIISHKAKFIHPLNIDRSSFDFGVVEVFNRFRIVKKYSLNKKIFFIAVLLKFIILFLGILKGNIRHFLRSLGNIVGIFKIIINSK
jgi:glycosyltransferase involved in cell wall biosynthesis